VPDVAGGCKVQALFGALHLQRQQQKHSQVRDAQPTDWWCVALSPEGYHLQSRLPQDPHSPLVIHTRSISHGLLNPCQPFLACHSPPPHTHTHTYTLLCPPSSPQPS
jgi:hypothetical protein